MGAWQTPSDARPKRGLSEMAARVAHPLTRVGRKKSRATWIHREMVTVPPQAGNRTRLIVYPFLTSPLGDCMGKIVANKANPYLTP